MAMQSSPEHHSDARAGRNAVWVIGGLVVILAIAIAAVVVYYGQYYG
jgi:hypothetical protein